MFSRSFRARLTWFFIVIVVLPMVIVTLALFKLVADSERGKSDAQLSQAATSAKLLFGEHEARAAAAGRDIAGSAALAEAIAGDSDQALEARLAAEARRVRAARVVLELDGRGRQASGLEDAVAGATTTLKDPEGAPVGTLRTSVTTAREFAAAVHALTALDTIVSGPSGVLASTLPAVAAGQELPEGGDHRLGDRTYRLTTLTAPAFEGEGSATVRVLFDAQSKRKATQTSRIELGGLLLAFLVLACLFALTLSRSLQMQVQRLLDAARRLGSGELDVKVPTEGDDEFAALGGEFNAMARQLQSRLEELTAERERLQHAIRRVGGALATGLDRDALLEIVVSTAVDGVAAATGRASAREAPGGPLQQRASVGEDADLDAVLDAVEEEVLQSREAAEVARDDAHALSHPLRPSDSSTKVAGLVSVARRGRAFTGADRDLFNYLASQASVSIENVDLHETVQRQAVTDELTGLFNHRRFQEVIAVEVERAKRFEQPLGLIMLDLDDFKNVNDRYGHLQGDQVLREVARILLDTSREIDEPARYGGEEMAVALPQTDLEGASLFAERLRARIESLEVPMVRGGDGVVRITASVGAAALPQSSGPDKDALVQAADAALYRAKRLGKNRVVKAG